MTATDTITESRLVDLPPEAGDIDAVVFEPDEAWLRQAPPDQQKTAMWRWFATRYEDPNDPESSGPHGTSGDRVLGDEESDIRADEVLHGRFDGCVPRAVVDELVRSVQQRVGNVWARRGIDKFSS